MSACRACGKPVTLLRTAVEGGDGLCAGTGRNISCWSRCQTWGRSKGLPIWNAPVGASTEESVWVSLRLNPVLVDQWLEAGCPYPDVPPRKRKKS